MLLGFLLLLLNFGISWWNARAVGQSWVEARAMGGWARVMAWSGAIMSACGFTYCYLIMLAFGAGAAGYLPPEYVKAALQLGYVIIILPILGSGLMIWLDSLRAAWRERTFGSVAVAGWNTYAQFQNAYDAAVHLPGILDNLGDVFDDEDGLENAVLCLVLMIVAFSLAGGVMTTALIVKSTARKIAARCPVPAKSY